MTCCDDGESLFLVALKECRRDQMAAIDEGRDAHHGLQRRNREAMTERDGDRVELAPVSGDNRLGALRQFGLQPIELPEFFQERLVPLDPDGERDARGANV